MKTLIIIPAYNESGSIETVVNDLIDNYSQYDYIVVNDGSKDCTAEICKNNNYNVLNLPVNLGLAGGFQAGMKYAYKNGYDFAIQFDGDGQHNPKYIEQMLNKFNEGDYDIVVGSRFIEAKKSKNMRMLGSNLIQFAIKITTKKNIFDPTSGMRMYDKKMIKEFALNINYGPEPDTISYLIKNGATIAEVPVKMNERKTGESYLNIRKSIMYMLRMFISILFVQFFRKRI